MKNQESIITVNKFTGKFLINDLTGYSVQPGKKY